MYYLPSNPYLLIAACLIIITCMVADFKPNLNLSHMKKLWAWLMLQPFDIVFLRRLSSIERHIHLAVDQVSFDTLRVAQSRIDYELKYTHSQRERDMVNELAKQA